MRTIDSMTWDKINDEKRDTYLRVGGTAPEFFLENWPFFNDVQLPYFGTAIKDGVTMHLFLDSNGDESWELEDGPNCALIEGEGKEVPAWITLKPVKDQVLFCANAYGTDDVLDEPRWLQDDETPDDYEFVGQIPSQVDGVGGTDIVIGGYGTAYVFLSSDQNSARMLWQS